MAVRVETAGLARPGPRPYRWGMEYRHDHFRARDLVRDLTFSGGPRPGEFFPDFDLPSGQLERVRKADYLGRPLLVTFASITDPMSRAAVPVLARLYDRHRTEVAFLTVYVREAHPGERFPQPHELERKMEHAWAFARQLQIPWTVAVDAPDGAFHRACGGNSNAVYLVDEAGYVAFRALWSGAWRPLRVALDALVDHGRLPERERTPYLGPLLAGFGTMHETLAEAGPTAMREMRRRAPPAWLVGEIAWRLRALPPVWRGAVAAGATAGGLLALGAGAAAALRRPEPKPLGRFVTVPRWGRLRLAARLAPAGARARGALRVGARPRGRAAAGRDRSGG